MFLKSFTYLTIVAPTLYKLLWFSIHSFCPFASTSARCISFYFYTNRLFRFQLSICFPRTTYSKEVNLLFLGYGLKSTPGTAYMPVSKLALIKEQARFTKTLLIEKLFKLRTTQNCSVVAYSIAEKKFYSFYQIAWAKWWNCLQAAEHSFDLGKETSTGSKAYFELTGWSEISWDRTSLKLSLTI